MFGMLLMMAVLVVPSAQANQIDGYFIAAQVTWTNMPNADTELIGTPRLRLDLTNMTLARFVVQIPAGTVGVGADCRVQYATSDGGAFANLDGSSGPELPLSPVQLQPH